MFGSQQSHNAAATWYVKRCRVSAFGTSTMNVPKGTLKSAVYIGSEENKIVQAIKRWFISDSGASGPSCASITINHYPNAATRPQQVKPRRHAHTPLKKTRLFAPQFLSFTYPSFLSTRTVPPKIPIISPDFTGHTALLYLSYLFIPKPTESAMSLAINTSRPLVSSPLASPTSPSRQAARTLPIRKPSFPASRPLRPFPSITTTAVVNGTRGATKKPVKIIEPPKNYSGGCFVLNLTQAELSRRD